jgi:hypothetical protein
VVSPMHDDFIREHIEAAAGRGEPATPSVITRVAGGCWPGGTEDRSEPGAIGWVRRWRPAARLGLVPVCSCSSADHCAVCN